MPPSLTDPLIFPISQRQLPNRLNKAALTEGLANPNTSQPNEKHFQLYAKLGQGCGTIQTGNVVVDRRHRENPRNVVLDESSDLEAFRTWAEAIHSFSGNSLAIMQLSHPGRQSPLACTRPLGTTPVAPSSGVDTRLVLPGRLGAILGKLLLKPARALEAKELPTIVQQFATTAKLAEQSGFDGVAIHAAHGYLLAQFLSPRSNKRTDEYGQKRGRLLFEVIAAIRTATSSKFVVGVKVNCKDQTRDGIEREEECLQLIRDLSELEQLDFIELSGGSFEDALFFEKNGNKPTFAAFAERVAKEVPRTAKTPKTILTGGFRTKAAMEAALQKGWCDVIGLGRPLINNPSWAQELLANEPTESSTYCSPLTKRLPDIPLLETGAVEAALNSLWYQRQLHRIAQAKLPDPQLSFLYTLTITFFWVYVWDWNFTGIHLLSSGSSSGKKND